MSGYYIYLLSSLPMLQFDHSPPISFKQFLKFCASSLPQEELSLLKNISLNGEYPRESIQSCALSEWRAFDRALRNELVKIRAVRRHRDAQKYLRGDAPSAARISRIALTAQRNPSHLDSERMLDKERWYFLEEIGLGHYFDLDALIVYVHKLLILEKWQRIRAADKHKLMLEALA